MEPWIRIGDGQRTGRGLWLHCLHLFVPDGVWNRTSSRDTIWPPGFKSSARAKKRHTGDLDHRWSLPPASTGPTWASALPVICSGSPPPHSAWVGRVTLVLYFLVYHIREILSNRLSLNCFDLGTECDGVVTIVLLPASPQSISAALIERIAICVRAVALCKGGSFE